jgi:transcriptional regulator with XRE-family HTH domain
MFQFKNLGNFREQRLISRAEMARKTGLSPLTINKLEGGRVCRPDTAKKILESLEIYLTGNSFVYDEKKTDAVIYTSPFVNSSNAQLILKRVQEDEYEDDHEDDRKDDKAKAKSAVKKKPGAVKKTTPKKPSVQEGKGKEGKGKGTKVLESKTPNKPKLKIKG